MHACRNNGMQQTCSIRFSHLVMQFFLHILGNKLLHLRNQMLIQRRFILRKRIGKGQAKHQVGIGICIRWQMAK